MESVLLSARDRVNGVARALECDANGALHAAVVVAAGATTIADGGDVAQGATTDAEAAAGNGTVIALLKRLRTLLGFGAVVGGGAQATALRVTLANDSTGTVGVLNGGDATQGAVADAAVITDANGTISAKLRGLVKWAFERMPASLGQKAMAASLPVVVASDQGAVPTMAKGPFTAVLGIEALAASAMYQLIDLSDTANYPQSGTAAIILKRLRLHAEKAATAAYDIWVGVVSEVDATDGSAKWLHGFHLEANGNPTDGTDRFAQELEFNLNAQVAGNVVIYYVSNLGLSGSVLLQTDVALVSPIGSANPAPGDLVVYVEEVSGTGTIDFTISADYDTV
jgi:hypothetical protein